MTALRSEMKQCTKQVVMTKSTTSGGNSLYLISNDIFIIFCVYVAARRPTYGELIDLFEESSSNEELLFAKFKTQYPTVHIGRPKRFHDTVNYLKAELIFSFKNSPDVP